MLSELKTRRRLVGIKQIRKAIEARTVEKIFLADDADPAITAPVAREAAQAGVTCVRVATMRELGQACAIDVGASAAAILK